MRSVNKVQGNKSRNDGPRSGKEKFNPNKLTLTSTNDLDKMMNDYIEETNNNLNYEISFVKIDFPIEDKLNAYIVNLYAYEEIDKEIGHWVVVLTKGRNALIYTCFGLYSLSLLKSLGEMGYDNVVFDLSADQPTNSKSCGFYCLRYIIDRQWRKMTDYLWFVSTNSKNPKHMNVYNKEEKLCHMYDKFNLVSKKIDEKNKAKLNRNNRIYQKTLR